MVTTAQQKEQIKRDLAACLSREKEVRKVVVFGSFLTSETPNDLDVAIFQDSDEPYLPPGREVSAAVTADCRPDSHRRDPGPPERCGWPVSGGDTERGGHL